MLFTVVINTIIGYENGITTAISICILYGVIIRIQNILFIYARHLSFVIIKKKESLHIY